MTKALFLDRDGIVNIEKNYVYRIADFEFCEGIFELCLKYQHKGYLIIIITNQAGIARGYYTEADFEKLTTWMLDKFSEKGIEITKVYYCPHHPEFTGECECRKPNPGMIFQARKEFNIDVANSILVGDKDSDIQAGIRAGIRKNFKNIRFND
jgi:D-glycero-D-manno-heptose 1,7-bisphosphate phosphatase